MFYQERTPHQITFTTQQPPGVIFQHVLDWEVYGKLDSLEVQWVSKNPYEGINSTGKKNDSTFSYKWSFNRKNDSTTIVQTKIRNVAALGHRNLNFHFGIMILRNEILRMLS